MKNKEKKMSAETQHITTIDKIIHEPARLTIMAYLYIVESTDLNKLEAAGYIKVIKEFVGKKPHTMLQLTKKGRSAFEEYRKNMKEFLNEVSL